MHAVYVVCAGDDDFFVELTAVSLASLRISNPEYGVTVITDHETLRAETPALKYLRDHCDKLLPVDIGDPTSFRRSRRLKCSLTHLVEGPFLALDSDTLVVDSLAGLQQLSCDIAAAPDLNSAGKRTSCNSIADRHFAPIGWDAPAHLYLNSGVVYFSGNSVCRDFGQRYISAWNDYSTKTGRFNDQPAFNHAIHVANPRLSILGTDYNAQISMNQMTARGAKIIHFFTGGFEGSVQTVAHVLSKELKQTGRLDIALLQAAIERKNPWTEIDTITKALATKQPAHVVAQSAGKSLIRKMSGMTNRLFKH